MPPGDDANVNSTRSTQSPPKPLAIERAMLSPITSHTHATESILAITATPNSYPSTSILGFSDWPLFQERIVIPTSRMLSYNRFPDLAPHPSTTAHLYKDGRLVQTRSPAFPPYGPSADFLAAHPCPRSRHGPRPRNRAFSIPESKRKPESESGYESEADPTAQACPSSLSDLMAARTVTTIRNVEHPSHPPDTVRRYSAFDFRSVRGESSSTRSSGSTRVGSTSGSGSMSGESTLLGGKGSRGYSKNIGRGAGDKDSKGATDEGAGEVDLFAAIVEFLK
ncbi:hypothetical protein BOTBODRAFT_174594 [Botryobasidium botryosum FD-172 SS1]|uniref:Uncharacterized protein n=1 Tax=Botryobasidium botryosum (strain FD-172 SS1) TaxID=930990 RepID=A0A067MSE7_BOTB1|nr:hypothetical protein BOTBODRAFT_174594 [Botryobasidium botryosum FD-172 SS1]